MYKKILFLGLVLAMSFAFMADAVRAADGILTAAINPLMVNADANNPTGVRGQSEVKIASFNIIALPSKNGVSVNRIVVKNNSDKNLSLAKDFQNLKLKHDSIQIAPTIGALSPWASSTYAFIPSTAINIPSGQQYTIDVYADILTNAININYAYSAVSLDKLTGINLFTGSAIGWGTKYNLSGEVDVIGQNVYVAPKGSLSVATRIDTPLSYDSPMSETGHTFGIFKLVASPAEDVYVTKIILTDALSGITAAATGSIVNLKIYSDNGAQLGSTVAFMNSGSGSNAIASFNNINLGIQKGQSRTITLSGDINSYPYAVSGSSHQFKIATGTDVSAVGIVSSQVINADNTLIIGGVQTIYRSVPVVYNAMSNVFGGQGMYQQIGKYTFKNYSPNNYSITVSDIDLTINSTINNSATTSVRLYKDYLGGTPIAEKWFIGGSDFSSINNWDSFTPFTIDAVDGFGYADIIVVADTYDAVATNSISTSIGIDGMTWSDGVSQSNHINGYPYGFPIIGATVMY